MSYAGSTSYRYTHNNISFRPIIGYDCLHSTLILGQWDNEELMFTLRYSTYYCVSISIRVMYVIIIYYVADRRRTIRLSVAKCSRFSADVCTTRGKHFFFGQKYSAASLCGDVSTRDRLMPSVPEMKKKSSPRRSGRMIII